MDGTRRSLQKMESPFNWEFPSMTKISFDRQIKSLIEKTQTISNENQFQSTRYCLADRPSKDCLTAGTANAKCCFCYGSGCTLQLILAYEMSSKVKDYTRALKYIDECKAHLRNLAWAGCNEPLFLNIDRPLRHVLEATKAHILFDSGAEDEAKAIVLELKLPANALISPKDKAGLLGLKAAMLLYYGTPGYHMALKSAELASHLEPSEAEWHFIIGNAMGRIRRVENGEISLEMEFAHIEKACNLRKDSTYIVHLGTLYAEYSSFLYFNKDPKSGKFEMAKSESYTEKAIEQFREALALRPDSTSTMARVAHGLIRIRHKKLLDLKFVKSLLDRVVELAPNNCMVYHDLGFYYDKFENNINKAVANLEKGHELGNIKALTYMASLKWKYGKKSEIVQDLQNGLDKYSEKNHLAEIHSMLASAYILIENDWAQGVQHITYSLQVDNSAKYLVAFPGFGGKKTNFLETMIHEVQKKMVQERDKKKLNSYEAFLKECNLLDLQVGPRPMNFQDWAKIQRGVVIRKF